jgi:branched-chain amino acid transport system permease protein
MLIAQQLVNGLAQGSIYAIIALGLTMIYGLLGIANFAQGQFLLVGAYTAVVCVRHGISVYAALPLALLAGWLAGAAVERVFFRPIERQHFKGLLVSVGVTAAAQSVFFVAFGANTYTVPDLTHNAVVRVGGIALIDDRLILMLFAGLIFAAVGLLLRYAKAGQAVRAAAENRDAALLVGVPVGRVLSVSFSFGAAVTAVLGVLMAGVFTVTPDLGNSPLLFGFVALILGGPASPAGALVGGLVVGQVEVLAGGFVSSNLEDVFVYLLVIVILLLRPRGLFPSAQVERA